MRRDVHKLHFVDTYIVLLSCMSMHGVFSNVVVLGLALFVLLIS